MFQAGGHLLNLDEFVTVVLVEYTLDTHSARAQLTKVLDCLIVVPRTVDVVLLVLHCRSTLVDRGIGNQTQDFVILDELVGFKLRHGLLAVVIATLWVALAQQPADARLTKSMPTVR